jgi:hypothetical protein
MKIIFSVLLSLIIASYFTGCGNKPDVTGKGKVLTIQDLKDVQNSIGPFSPFDKGIKKAVEKLGKPHKTEGRMSYWYVKDEKACTEFFIEDFGGNMVGGQGITSMGPGTYMFDNCPAR